MSFLDATGLGTFWAKLKSTFQGPVSEVYKDALTPINLLPNSDFSRDRGYTNTFTSLLPLNNNFYNFYQSWSVNRLNAEGHNTSTITNFAITVSKNSLNIQFDKTQGTFYFFIQNNNMPVLNNQTFTFMCDVIFGSDNYNNNINISPSTGCTGDTIYYYKEGQHRVNVMTSTYSGTAHYRLAMSTTINPEDEHLLDAGHVNMTFKNLALYEGEYKDAPVTASLDVKPSNQFMLSDEQNLSKTLFANPSYTITSGTNGYFVIGCINNNCYHKFTCKIGSAVYEFEQSYSSSGGHYVKGRNIMFVGYASNITKVALIAKSTTVWITIYVQNLSSNLSLNYFNDILAITTTTMTKVESNDRYISNASVGTFLTGSGYTTIVESNITYGL